MTWNVVMYARTKRHVFVARGLYATSGAGGFTRTSESSLSRFSGGVGASDAMPVDRNPSGLGTPKEPHYHRRMGLLAIVATLEKTFGKPKAKRETAFAMLIRQTCGYPASDEACAKGWAALSKDVGTSAKAILAAPVSKLVKAMRAGGIVPELRAKRLVEIATKAKAGADLSSRAVLKKMPTIGDPGADKILLFAHGEPIAAVPSNATQVIERILGLEGSYAQVYRASQKALDADLPKTADARARAYLVLKRHGQTICKRSKPLCEECPLTRECDYFDKASRASAS
jgi:endonuclease III